MLPVVAFGPTVVGLELTLTIAPFPCCPWTCDAPTASGPPSQNRTTSSIVSPGVSWMVMSNESPDCVALARSDALVFDFPFVLRARTDFAGAAVAGATGAGSNRAVRNRAGGGSWPSHDA